MIIETDKHLLVNFKLNNSEKKLKNKASREKLRMASKIRKQVC